MSMGPLEYIHQFPGYDPFRDADDWEFIPELAEEKIDWIEANIVHTEGRLAGEPYILAPHQRGTQYMLWGWYHKTRKITDRHGRTRGIRRIVEALYYVSRKGSKSTDCAVILNTIIFTEPDWRMQLYGCASAARQSAKVSAIMAAQIKANPEMEKRSTVYEVRKVPISIVRNADNTSFIPLPDNAEVEHGGNVRACLCDEIHTYKSAALPIVMRTGMVAQEEPLFLSATTAAYKGENYCNRTLAYAKKVRDGVIENPRYLPMIWEPSEDKLKANPDYWQTEACWREGNPMLGVTISLETMKQECARAIAEPEYQNEFKRLLCNIQTDASESMIAAHEWAKGDGDFPAGHFDGRNPLAATLDLSSSKDTTSLCLEYKGENGEIECVWHTWIPEQAARDQERDHGTPFSVWFRDGWVKVTPGDQIDYGKLREDLIEIFQRAGVSSFYVDPLFQSKQICQELQAEGYEVIYFKCNATNLTAPIDELLRLMGEGRILHGNNPLMRYQASCAMMLRIGQFLKHLDKRNSKGQVDGIMTLLMGVPIMLEKPAIKTSTYEERGFADL